MSQNHHAILRGIGKGSIVQERIIRTNSGGSVGSRRELLITRRNKGASRRRLRTITIEIAKDNTSEGTNRLSL